MKKTIYEYGAMSSKFSCEAENKLTAYATMTMHYENRSHLVVIYTPEEFKKDSWFSLSGKSFNHIEKVFGGVGCFDSYIQSHIEEIRECYKSIKQIN